MIEMICSDRRGTSVIGEMKKKKNRSNLVDPINLDDFTRAQ